MDDNKNALYNRWPRWSSSARQRRICQVLLWAWFLSASRFALARTTTKHSTNLQSSSYGAGSGGGGGSSSLVGGASVSVSPNYAAALTQSVTNAQNIEDKLSYNEENVAGTFQFAKRTIEAFMGSTLMGSPLTRLSNLPQFVGPDSPYAKNGVYWIFFDNDDPTGAQQQPGTAELAYIGKAEAQTLLVRLKQHVADMRSSSSSSKTKQTRWKTYIKSKTRTAYKEADLDRFIVAVIPTHFSAFIEASLLTCVFRNLPLNIQMQSNAQVADLVSAFVPDNDRAEQNFQIVASRVIQILIELKNKINDSVRGALEDRTDYSPSGSGSGGGGGGGGVGPPRTPGKRSVSQQMFHTPVPTLGGTQPAPWAPIAPRVQSGQSSLFFDGGDKTCTNALELMDPDFDDFDDDDDDDVNYYDADYGDGGMAERIEQTSGAKRFRGNDKDKFVCVKDKDKTFYGDVPPPTLENINELRGNEAEKSTGVYFLCYPKNFRKEGSEPPCEAEESYPCFYVGKYGQSVILPQGPAKRGKQHAAGIRAALKGSGRQIKKYQRWVEKMAWTRDSKQNLLQRLIMLIVPTPNTLSATKMESYVLLHNSFPYNDIGNGGNSNFKFVEDLLGNKGVSLLDDSHQEMTVSDVVEKANTFATTGPEEIDPVQYMAEAVSSKITGFSMIQRSRRAQSDIVDPAIGNP